MSAWLLFVDSTEVGITDTSPPSLVTQVKVVVDLTLRRSVTVHSAVCVGAKLFIVAAGVVVVDDVQERDRIFGADVDEVRSCAGTSERVGDVDVVVAVTVDAEETVVVVVIFVALEK